MGVNRGAAVAPFGGISKTGGGSGGFPHVYTVELIAERDGQRIVHVIAPLPENYQISFNTHFDTPMNQPISASVGGMTGAGQLVDSAGTVVQAATGATSRFKWLSNAVWGGGSAFQLDVPLVLQAHEDTREEIVNVVRDLLKLVAPSEEIGGNLASPGPHGLGAQAEGDLITVRIGKFIEMKECVVTSVNCDFDSQMDNKNGLPMSATVTVQVMSFKTTTKQDIDSYFRQR